MAFRVWCCFNEHGCLDPIFCWLGGGALAQNPHPRAWTPLELRPEANQTCPHFLTYRMRVGWMCFRASIIIFGSLSSIYLYNYFD